MKHPLAAIFISGLIVSGNSCAADAQYRVVESSGPEYHPNTIFSEQEDLSSPRYDTLLKTYSLDEVISGEEDEFARILLLRHWLKKRLVVDRHKPAELRNVIKMLAEGPGGGAYSCGHFEAAQNAVLNAVGYVTRCVISGPDGTEPDLTGTHGSNEVWCNSLGKWVLVDAEHDSHFEKDGVPLSALELRGAYLADGGQGVVRVKGPQREPQPKSKYDQWGFSPKAYAFISWRWQSNRFSIWPDNGSSEEVVYNDDFFKSNIWHRGGRKHWAYDADQFIRIEDPTKIYWTPNVLDIEVDIEGSAARVAIESCTPNLREYQMRRRGSGWETVGSNLTLELSAAREEFVFRSVNMAGVAGPGHRLIIGKGDR